MATRRPRLFYTHGGRSAAMPLTSRAAAVVRCRAKRRRVGPPPPPARPLRILQFFRPEMDQGCGVPPCLDQDGLAGGGDVDLVGAGNPEVPQVALELRVGGLQVKQGLRAVNKGFDRGRGGDSWRRVAACGGATRCRPSKMRAGRRQRPPDGGCALACRCADLRGVPLAGHGAPAAAGYAALSISKPRPAAGRRGCPGIHTAS